MKAFYFFVLAAAMIAGSSCSKGPTTKISNVEAFGLKGKVESILIHNEADYWEVPGTEPIYELIEPRPLTLIKYNENGKAVHAILYYVDTLNSVPIDIHQLSLAKAPELKYYDIYDDNLLIKRVVMDNADSLKRLMSFKYTKEGKLRAAAAYDFKYKREDLEHVFNGDKLIEANYFDLDKGRTHVDFIYDADSSLVQANVTNISKNTITRNYYDDYGRLNKEIEYSLSDTSAVLGTITHKYRGKDGKFSILKTEKGKDVSMGRMSYRQYFVGTQMVGQKGFLFGFIPIAVMKSELDEQGNVTHLYQKKEEIATMRYMYDKHGNGNYIEIDFKQKPTIKMYRFINYYDKE